MKTLPKDARATRNGIATDLHTRHENLEDAIEQFNRVLTEQWGYVEEAMHAYNETVAEANDWLQSIADDIVTYIEDRSEKWQDSPRGHAYQAWQQEYEQDTLEEIDLEKPELLALDIDAQVESLEMRSEDAPDA